MPYPFRLQRNSAKLIRNVTDAVNDVVDYTLISSLRLASELLIVGGLALALVFIAPLAATLGCGPARAADVASVPSDTTPDRIARKGRAWPCKVGAARTSTEPPGPFAKSRSWGGKDASATFEPARGSPGLATCGGSSAMCPGSPSRRMPRLPDPMVVWRSHGLPDANLESALLERSSVSPATAAGRRATGSGNQTLSGAGPQCQVEGGTPGPYRAIGSRSADSWQPASISNLIRPRAWDDARHAAGT
jgi:hypothetical protein